MINVDCFSQQAVAPAPREDKYVDDTTIFIRAIQNEDQKWTKLDKIVQYLDPKNNLGCGNLDL